MAVDEIQFTNNGSTTITNNPLGNNPGTDTTITVADGTAFPAVTAPEYAFATLQDSTGTYEIVKITAHAAAASSMTVERAADNTSINTWPNGTLIEMRPNAAIFEVIRDHDHDTEYSAIGHDHAALYVDVTGDTMTGDLNLVTAAASDESTKAASTQWVNDNYKFIDVPGSYIGIVLASTTVLSFLTVRAFSLPISLTGSIGECLSAPTNAVSFDIRKNGVSIGSMNFATSATSATFTHASSTSFAAGDVLSIVSPADTHDMEDLHFGLTGSLTF